MTASDITFYAYSDVLVVLGTAGLAVSLGRRLGLAPVLCWQVASLQLSEATLLGMGLAAGRVIATIHDKRDEFRRDLQAGLRGRVERAARTG